MKGIFHLLAVPTTQHWNHLPPNCTEVYTIYLVRQGEATHLCSLTPSSQADFVEHQFIGLDPEHPFVQDHAYQDDETSTYFDYLNFSEENRYLSEGFEVELDPRDFDGYEEHHEEEKREAVRDALWEEAREYARCNPPMIRAVWVAHVAAEVNEEKYYAVQYRDMHTAIHHLALFKDEGEACEYKEYLREFEEHPPVAGNSSFVEDVEVHYLNLPRRYGDEYDGVKLEYIYEGGVPDVW